MMNLSDLKQKNKAQNQFEREHNLTVCESKPAHLQLEITTRCNLRCITCARSYGHFIGEDMAPELFHKIETELFPTLLTMDLQGYGEPLLCRHFDTFFDAATNYSVRVGFITNGTLLNENNLAKFIKHSSYVGVSIDGATPATFNAIRPKADFNRICQRLKLFQQIKQDYPESGAELNIIFVAIKENISDLPLVLDLAEEWGAKNLIVLNFCLGEIPNTIQCQHLMHYPELANRIFAQTCQKASSYKVEVSMPAPFELHLPDATSPGSKDKKNGRKEPKFPTICIDPWWKTYIAVDGFIRPCCGTMEIMGDLKYQPFDQVWNGRKYRVLRKRVNSNYPPWYCRDCFLWYGITAGNPFNIKQKETLLDKADVAGQKVTRVVRSSARRLLGDRLAHQVKHLLRL